MGQYTQVDPIGLTVGKPTLYGYVFNPFFELDIFGLRRWRPDDPINQPIPDGSKNGRYPSWGTARRRYWKNQWNSAQSGDFTGIDMRPMENGRPRLDSNGNPIKLHHAEPQAKKPPDVHRQENLQELTREKHIDEHKRLREEAKKIITIMVATVERIRILVVVKKYRNDIKFEEDV